MAKSRDERHRYGQHYTPREVARLLAAFAISSPRDSVLDPSCGDGRLLEEALILKTQLAARSDSTGLAHEIFGVEQSQSAAEIARQTGARIEVADFFDIESSSSLFARSAALPFEYDAIIGNPPYIRHEIQGIKDKRRIEACLARDRAASPGVFWPRWSGRSDIYVYFFAHSLPFLKTHGRLVFLTASSWLDVGYGAPLREFLLNNFRVIAIVESGCESFFEDASINTAITVLEREPEFSAREKNSIRFVRFNRPLKESLSEERSGQMHAAVGLARDIERGKASSVDERYRMRIVAQSQLLNATTREPHQDSRTTIRPGWGKYLRADEVFFKVIARGRSRLRSLSNMASVRFGVKTGANEFFYVTEDGAGARAKKAEGGRQKADGESQRDGAGLRQLADVALVRRGITTGANEFFYVSRAETQTKNQENGEGDQHALKPNKGLTAVRDFAGKLRNIETTLLSPVVFSLKEIRGVLLEEVESQRMLFNCPLAADELSGTRALDYIASGELAGYDQRPTCASREPWYSVAREMTPAPLIFPSKVGERWVVALNRAGVFEDKKLYGIFPSDGVSELTLAALLNSTWARYCAEITCRQMTGAQAIADIDVAVAEQIMIPDPRDLSPSIKERVEAAIEALSRRPVHSIFEEVKLADRRRLDALTLEAIGFDKKAEREDVLDQLHEAVTELVRARLAKAGTR